MLPLFIRRGRSVALKFPGFLKCAGAVLLLQTVADQATVDVSLCGRAGVLLFWVIKDRSVLFPEFAVRSCAMRLSARPRLVRVSSVSIRSEAEL